MKILSQTIALEKLHDLKSDFARRIRSRYEHRAKSCATCETPGACCLDAHFVNVHITKLEAREIRNAIDRLPEGHRAQIDARIEATISRYELETDGDKTYGCPLLERGMGCLGHERGKPLPCITHACYENREDLPPDTLLSEAEEAVDELNQVVYRKPTSWLPIPLAIRGE